MSRKSKLALSLAIAMATLSGVSSLSAQTVWTDATGDWFNPANWSAGVPNSTNAAIINNGGTAQIAADGGMIGGIVLGANASDSGTLSMSGTANLSTNNTVEIAQAGTGTLNILSGAQLSSGRFVIADNAGSTGVATVSGAGSTWTNNVTCFVGFLGTATLNITAGGQVSDSSASIGESGGSMGTVLVDGTGSTWSQVTTLAIGGSGTGSLTISNGGNVSSLDSNFGSGVIGDNPGSSGMVTVTDPGSMWTLGAVVAIGGNGGTGTLNILNGGAISSSTGTIGISSGSTGTADINGTGSTWTIGGSLTVGGSGTGAGQGSGTLIIENSGNLSANDTTVAKTGTLEIGLDPHLSGSLMFNGGTLRTIADTTFANNTSLGAGGMTTDSNGFNSTLSGIFSGAGSLTKVGSGTVTLSGANTYTGGTTVNSGTLLINNTSGSGTGTGAVQVNAGTLGGNGTISGAVTIGTGSGTGAIISPGASVGTLTIQSALSLNSDATYKFELNSSTPTADKITANGVTISNATFSLTDLGSGHLALGTSFIVIDNTSNSAIAGLFSNLADGSTFTNKGNTYLVSYEGGTGNDLTLTVVPEPETWQLFSVALALGIVVRQTLRVRLS